MPSAFQIIECQKLNVLIVPTKIAFRRRRMNILKMIKLLIFMSEGKP
ncbi:hypothetical protein CES85_2893 (plasmid) [Ochrobactrum quorumnocens]|uniref:Uncharacterized protein n=1 Tax=Ochrobactrum quorumnocens TaxID=271865 RepID=A0A248UNA5_9HYPH|nr:hypothetical protein CES85_2893 [[Ochrobactrum] quorumnocens]